MNFVAVRKDFGLYSRLTAVTIILKKYCNKGGTVVISLFSGEWSPESTLKQAFKDLKAGGIDGVKKHLTESALEKLNNIEAWTTYPLFDIITNAVAGSSKDELIKEKIAGCDWTIVDVLKGKEQAKGIVCFEHKDGFSGTVDVVLVKDGLSWKIDSLNSPKLD